MKTHLAELLATYPALRLLTGDAIYVQRPLLELFTSPACDYLFQIKGNQGDVLDALKACFSDKSLGRPSAEVTEKRGVTMKRVGFGPTWTMPHTFASV